MGGVVLLLLSWLHPGLGPAGGRQHVVLCQQLVELLLPDQHGLLSKLLSPSTTTSSLFSLGMSPIPQLGCHHVMWAEVLLLSPIEEAV